MVSVCKKFNFFLSMLVLFAKEKIFVYSLMLFSYLMYTYARYENQIEKQVMSVYDDILFRHKKLP